MTMRNPLLFPPSYSRHNKINSQTVADSAVEMCSETIKRTLNILHFTGHPYVCIHRNFSKEYRIDMQRNCLIKNYTNTWVTVLYMAKSHMLKNRLR